MSEDERVTKKGLPFLAAAQRSNCVELQELASAMLSARDGTSAEVIAAFNLNAISWFLSLENRVRTLEGKEPVAIEGYDFSPA